MKTLRTLLADDHGLVRAGIRALLEQLDGVEVVAESGDGREAINLVRTHRVDLVLMDLAMPDLNGLEATARIIKEFPETKVIIVSMYGSEEYVLHALRCGACGYLLKDAASAELEQAINAVRKGETYLSPTISRRVLEASTGTTDPGSPLDQLSPRQREILQLLAEGKTVKEIAFLLNLSAKTVETHRARVMERLDLRHIPNLVRFAMRTGLVAPADAEVRIISPDLRQATGQ
jgi:DNA-binding NarL/FixJ family response regulator